MKHTLLVGFKILSKVFFDWAHHIINPYLRIISCLVFGSVWGYGIQKLVSLSTNNGKTRHTSSGINTQGISFSKVLWGDDLVKEVEVEVELEKWQTRIEIKNRVRF